MSAERRAESPRKRLDSLIAVVSGSPQSILFERANERDIVLVESKLGYRLPFSYRRFLSFTDGAQLFQTEEFFGTKDDISDNITRRSILTIRAQVPNLPTHLIPFHQNIANLYCFDTDSSKATSREYPVVRWDPVSQTAEAIDHSFTEWLEKLINEYD